MSIPTRPVLVEPYQPGHDAHGSPTDSWGAAQQVPVFGWAPTSMSQPVEGNRRPVDVQVDVLAPSGTATGPRDRWHLPEGHFEQVGRPEDFGNGPWWPDAGVRIGLKRVEG